MRDGDSPSGRDWIPVERQVSGPLVTLGAVLLCDQLTRHGMPVPVPMALLLATVVWSAARGGVRPAILSTVFVLLYALHYFSTPGAPLTYHGLALTQVALMFCVTTLVALIVGAQRQRELDRLADQPAALALLQDPVDASFRGDSERAVVGEAARRAADALGEWAVVRLQDDAGRLGCVAVAAREAAQEAALDRLLALSATASGGRPTPVGVWGADEPVMLAVGDRALDALAGGRDELAVYRALAPVRILTVPIVAAGQRVGLLELGARRPDALPDAVVPRAVRLAARIADALRWARAAARADEGDRRFRMLFEGHPSALWIFDAETLGLLDMNDAMVRMYGYDRSELSAMTIMDLLPPEPPVVQRPADRDGASREGIARARHRRKDRTELDVELVSQPVTFAGRPARLTLATDVTERTRTTAALHEAERQLRRTQKLDAVGRLAGGLAHDFNNVLTAIGGYAELLLADTDPAESRWADLDQIRRAADRGVALTSQLLALTGREAPVPRAVNVNDAVVALEGLLQRLLGADVRLELALDPGLGRVELDRGRLDQIVMNLALNARDAMPRGGTLTIETAERQIATPGRARTSRAGRYVVLGVTDTGRGMDEETQSHLFEPFFSSGAAPQAGGLGLAIVHGIVKECGGVIRIASEPGEGTTVRIFLPRMADQPAAPGDAPPDDPLRGHETILVVEDEAAVRTLVCKVLAPKGYTVLEARHGQDALLVAAAHAGPIDLLLTDLVMPGLGGRSLAEQLAAPRPAMQVLYMSGYAADQVAEKGMLTAGALIAKPFTSERLLRRIRQALDHAPTLQPSAHAGLERAE